jgi:Polyketide synthase dehydratase
VFQVDVRKVGWYAEKDHVVFGQAVMPGAAHVCGVVEQSVAEWKWGGVEVSEVEIREAVVLRGGEEEEEVCVLQYVYERSSGKWEARQMAEQGWKVHARGVCRAWEEMEGQEEKEAMEAAELAEAKLEAVGNTLWNDLGGIAFGESFRWMAKASSKADGTVYSELAAPEAWRQRSKLRVPVEVMDSLFQTSLLLLGKKQQQFMAPFAVGKVVVRGDRFESGKAVQARTTEEGRGATSMVLSVVARQEGGEGMRVEVERLTLVEASQESFMASMTQKEELCFETVWKVVTEGNKSKKESLVVRNVRVVAAKGDIKVGEAARVAGFEVVEVGSESDAARVDMLSGETVVVNALGVGATGKERVRWSVALWKRVVEVRGVAVYTVTERAVQVGQGNEQERANPWARAIWALGRSVSAECGELVSGHVMVDVESSSKLEGVWAEVRREKGEEDVGREVACRDGKRFVGEVRKVRDWPMGNSEYFLEFSERGAISKLRFARSEPVVGQMAEGEVEVKVEAC